MKEGLRTYIQQLLIDAASSDTNIVLLIVLLVIMVIVLDAISMVARKKRQEAGVDQLNPSKVKQEVKTIPIRHYISDIQGLAGTPDAVIRENGYLIPVERKPLSNKIRDRYIMQLLVYMRLIEEFEGKRPPYGYLLLGRNSRRVKIFNSPERQAELQAVIDTMRLILEKKESAKATPHIRKCRRCNVRNYCAYRARETAPPPEKKECSGNLAMQ